MHPAALQFFCLPLCNFLWFSSSSQTGSYFAFPLFHFVAGILNSTLFAQKEGILINLGGEESSIPLCFVSWKAKKAVGSGKRSASGRCHMCLSENKQKRNPPFFSNVGSQWSPPGHCSVLQPYFCLRESRHRWNHR